MKQIKNIRNFLLISLIAGGTWIGCDDANYSTLDTHVFFEEALTATSTKVTVMGSGETNVTLNAHIKITQIMICQIFIIYQIPLTAGIFARPTITFTRKVYPFEIGRAHV